MSLPASTRAAGYGLDALNLSVANIQTGFGPFIAVYLTTVGWTQTSIGIALSIGTIVAMVSQIPAGALVDAVRRKSLVAAVSLIAFSASALMFAVQPLPLMVYLAEGLHGFSSCTLGPSIAAMSLALVGQAELGPRLGRNTRFGAIGNATGAALMGAFGYYFSSRSVFFLAAALTLPAIASVWPLWALDRNSGVSPVRRRDPSPIAVGALLRDRRLVIFSACVMLFTFGNAAMLPLASSSVTERAPTRATLLIAAFIVLPQFIVAAISPGIGRYAQQRSRRNILTLALAALSVRGLLFALVANPTLLIAVQILDGISAACLGVLIPLVASDIAGQTTHYNLVLALIGFAVGIGATVSTTVGGMIADQIGQSHAILVLAAAALGSTAMAAGMMPETAPVPVAA